MSRDANTFTFELMNGDYIRYHNNPLVDKRDQFLKDMAGQLHKLDCHIEDEADAALEGITYWYETFVRPLVSGDKDYQEGREIYAAYRRLANCNEFKPVCKMWNKSVASGGWDYSWPVTFYRKGGMLLTTSCSAAIINDKTPTSDGDWDRIRQGDIPQVYLQKLEGNATTKVVEDPIKTDAKNLHRCYPAITSLKEFDQHVTSKFPLTGEFRDTYRSYYPQNPTESYYRVDPVKRSLLEHYLNQLAPKPPTPRTKEQLLEEQINIIMNPPLHPITRLELFTSEQDLAESPEGEPLTISGPPEALVKSLRLLYREYAVVKLIM